MSHERSTFQEVPDLMSTCIPCMDGDHRRCRYIIDRDCVCRCEWGRNALGVAEQRLMTALREIRELIINQYPDPADGKLPQGYEDGFYRAIDEVLKLLDAKLPSHVKASNDPDYPSVSRGA